MVAASSGYEQETIGNFAHKSLGSIQIDYMHKYMISVYGSWALQALAIYTCMVLKARLAHTHTIHKMSKSTTQPDTHTPNRLKGTNQ